MAENKPSSPEPDNTGVGNSPSDYLHGEAIIPPLSSLSNFNDKRFMKKLHMIAALAVLPFCLTAQALVSNSEIDSLSNVQLQTVQVVATRATAKTPVAYTNVRKAELSKSNYGRDIPYLLMLTPSVVATSDAGTGIGYSGFRVRGTDANRINITTNGVPLNDSESQSVFWVNMPDFASSIEDLQVQRGVGTSTNGAGAFGASVNMRTDNLGLAPYGRVDLSGGSFGTFRRSVKLGSGRIGRHWAVDARLSKIGSDGYVDRGSVDLKSYFAQVGYFGSNTALRFITFGGKEVTGIAWNGLSKEDEAKYGRRYNSAGLMYVDAQGVPHYYHNTDNYEQRHYHAIMTHSFSPSVILNLTAHYTAGYGYTDEYRTGRKLKEYALQPYVENSVTVKKTDLIRQKYLDNDFGGLIGSLNWHTGAWDLQFGASGNIYKGDHFGRITYIKKYNQPLAPDFEYYRNRADKREGAAFAKANWQITPELNMYVDLQYRTIGYTINGITDEYDEVQGSMQHIDLDKTFRFLNPKAGLTYSFDDAHTAYASVAVAHREPNRTNYTEAGIGQYPTPERLIDYELGYRYASPLLSAGVGLYYMQYKDQLVLDGRLSDVGQMLTSNVPDSYRMGLELTLGWQILPRLLRWDASFTMSRNKIDRYVQYTSVYDADYNWLELKEETLESTDIAYSPNVIAGSMLALSHAGFEMAWTSRFVSKQYLDNSQRSDRMLPSYWVNDLRLGYVLPVHFVKRVALGVQLNNLFNLMYASNAYIYDAGYVQASGELNAYADLRYYPQAGFNALGSLTIDF